MGRERATDLEVAKLGLNYPGIEGLAHSKSEFKHS